MMQGGTFGGGGGVFVVGEIEGMEMVMVMRMRMTMVGGEVGRCSRVGLDRGGLRMSRVWSREWVGGPDGARQ